MRSSIAGWGMAVAVLASAAPLTAQESVGHRAIVKQDYAKAERLLVAARRHAADRPELTLNLAAVYRETGRDAEARALYAQVMDQPAILLDMASGRVSSSHDVASIGLAALSPADTAVALR